MCEECEEFPPQYVAHFNKAGGKYWRPARKVAANSWAIDIRPVAPAAVTTRPFVCDEPAPQPQERIV
jgi:NAD-dependent dihydropyrimidine dehydrogenase PreA subunit